MPSKLHIKGFTLLELLIVLSIIGTLAALCFNSSSLLITKNEQQTLIDELRTSIQYAKIQAINRGHPLYLGPIDPSLDWSKGIKLMRLNKKTKNLQMVHQWPWDHRNWKITWTGVQASKSLHISNNPINAISNGTFTLVNIQTLESVQIKVNRLGRIRKVKEQMSL